MLGLHLGVLDLYVRDAAGRPEYQKQERTQQDRREDANTSCHGLLS
jgi:hypothetical protein